MGSHFEAGSEWLSSSDWLAAGNLMDSGLGSRKAGFGRLELGSPCCLGIGNIGLGLGCLRMEWLVGFLRTGCCSVGRRMDLAALGY